VAGAGARWCSLVPCLGVAAIPSEIKQERPPQQREQRRRETLVSGEAAEMRPVHVLTSWVSCYLGLLVPPWVS
jgi:hypothetical protein